MGGHDLGPALEPALHQACAGRLGAIEWFHAAWQRGGAATGLSTFRPRDDESPIPALVKLPVGPSEHRWTTGLGTVAPEHWHLPSSLALPTPRVLAHGLTLGSYDMAWLITERLTGDHLPRHMDEPCVLELMQRVHDFQTRAGQLAPVAGAPATPDWEKLLAAGRAVCHRQALADHQRWNEAIRSVQRALPTLARRWGARPMTSWCHGDVHAGNALRRHTPVPGGEGGGVGPCVLIDLALVHPGMWIEDALYFERQYWGHEAWIAGCKPVSALAKIRREAGISIEGNAMELANIRRVLMAGCAPAVIDREGASPAYLRAALGIIERLLPTVAR
jgi:hypothetical protein